MPKFLFDECFGHKVVTAISNLVKFHKSPCEVFHMKDLGYLGIADGIWTSQIGQEYILITSDRARKNGGDKLPVICKNKKITTVLLSKAMHNQNQFYKASAIISLWDKFLTIESQPVGDQYILKYSDKRNAQLIKKM